MPRDRIAGAMEPLTRFSMGLLLIAALVVVPGAEAGDEPVRWCPNPYYVEDGVPVYPTFSGSGKLCGAGIGCEDGTNGECLRP